MIFQSKLLATFDFLNYNIIVNGVTLSSQLRTLNFINSVFGNFRTQIYKFETLLSDNDKRTGEP